MVYHFSEDCKVHIRNLDLLHLENTLPLRHTIVNYEKKCIDNLNIGSVYVKIWNVQDYYVNWYENVRN